MIVRRQRRLQRALRHHVAALLQVHVAGLEPADRAQPALGRGILRHRLLRPLDARREVAATVAHRGVGGVEEDLARQRRLGAAAAGEVLVEQRRRLVPAAARRRLAHLAGNPTREPDRRRGRRRRRPLHHRDRGRRRRGGDGDRRAPLERVLRLLGEARDVDLARFPDRLLGACHRGIAVARGDRSLGRLERGDSTLHRLGLVAAGAHPRVGGVGPEQLDRPGRVERRDRVAGLAPGLDLDQRAVARRQLAQLAGDAIEARGIALAAVERGPELPLLLVDERLLQLGHPLAQAGIGRVDRLRLLERRERLADLALALSSSADARSGSSWAFTRASRTF